MVMAVPSPEMTAPPTPRPIAAAGLSLFAVQPVNTESVMDAPVPSQQIAPPHADPPPIGFSAAEQSVKVEAVMVVGEFRE